jgi:BirA family biotin operon repressor/biotin-[acetyl-CoA-carboxylase] ligase
MFGLGCGLSFNRERFEAAFQVLQSCGGVSAGDEAIALHLFDTLPSTNQTAWELLDRDGRERVVVIALQQEAGRGQRGRQWVSAVGGLYLSVGLMPDMAVIAGNQLILSTAWGITTALRTVPPILSGVMDTIPVQLKWLNDLILNGRKLGGILTETRIQHDRIGRAVVGVGINWTNPVPPVGINLASYLQNQPTPLIESLEMLAAIVLHGLFCGYRRWQQEGIQPILPEYFDLLSHRDQSLLVGDRVGKIVGISPDGELRVQVRAENTPESTPIGTGEVEEIVLKPGTISLGYDALVPFGEPDRVYPSSYNL